MYGTRIKNFLKPGPKLALLEGRSKVCKVAFQQAMLLELCGVLAL